MATEVKSKNELSIPALCRVVEFYSRDAADKARYATALRMHSTATRLEREARQLERVSAILKANPSPA